MRHYLADMAIHDETPGNPELTQANSAGWALIGLLLTMLLSSLGTSVANVALPTLARVFNAPFGQVQWIVIAYLLAITALIIGAGRLGDVIGRRRLMLAGITVFTAASMLCAVASSIWMLIAARALQGVGAAVMMALTLALVSGAVPKARTGSAMGLLGTMSAIGTALGPSLGGVLIASVGWRWIFLMNLPLGLLALLLVWRTLPDDKPQPRAKRVRFDLLGTVVLAVTLAAYAMALTTGQGDFGIGNGLLLVAAAMGVGLFLWVEAKAPAPLISWTMLRNPFLGAGLAMSALVTTVVMATLVVGPFYLSGALDLDAVRVGLVMSAGPVVAALVGVPAGRMVDRIGSQHTTLVGLNGMALGCALLALLPMQAGVTGYVIPLATVTAGYAAFQAANNTAVMTRIAADQRGVASALLNLSRNLGLITGASAMGAVFAVASKSPAMETAGADAVARGMRMTFALAALLVVLALAIAPANTRSVK